MSSSELHFFYLSKRVIGDSQHRRILKKIMRITETKTQNTKLPFIQGRANEITSLLDSFFTSVSSEQSESELFDLLYSRIYHYPGDEPSRRDISNSLFVVKQVADLVRKLEIINNQLKGGSSC